MDRYTQFGLRGEADEQVRRAFRDGFRRVGLSPQQMQQAMQWYSDHGRHLGDDDAKLRQSFAEFATSKGWSDQHRDAAVGLYGQVRDQGPGAVTSPAPSAEEDAATIARAQKLLRTDPRAYWRDAELQEAQLEALERQEAAKAASEPGAGVTADAVPPRPEAALGAVAPMPADRAADERRRDEITAMMRDPSRSQEYWQNEAIQQEFQDVVGRLGGASSAGRPTDSGCLRWSVAPAVVPEIQGRR